MKLLVALTLVLAVAHGMKGKRPKTLEECLDKIDMKMKIKHAMMEGYMENKMTCMDGCLDDDQKKCMGPAKEFMDKMKAEHATIKAEFMKVKDAGKACLMKVRDEDKGKPLKDRRCSDEPISYGPCGIGIIKKMIPEKTEMCLGKCIMKGVLGKVKELGLPDEVMSRVVAKMMKMKGGKGGPPFARSKRSPMMMMGKGGKGKGGGMKCLHAFCKMDALMKCAEESKFEEQMKKIGQKMEETFDKMREMFPAMCECMKPLAEKLGVPMPDELKNAKCSDLPNNEVCDAVRPKHGSSSSSSGSGEMKRRKRQAEKLWGYALEADIEEAYEELQDL